MSVRRCGRSLVQRVSLAAERGELLALCGPKGGGAETMLELLAGTIAPDHGRVLVDGVTALPGIARPREPRRTSRGGWEARALLDAGHDAPVLLMTAPTDDLDDGEAGALLARCVERAREGAAVVVTLDDPRRAAAYADTVALFVAGRMLGWGSPGVALVPALRLLGVAAR